MPPIIERDYLEFSGDTFSMTKRRAKHQDIRPLKIAILNLMPNKLETEKQLFRVLSNTPLQLEISLIRTESYQSKHTPPEVLRERYRYFSELKDEKFDAFIITGSPIEKMDFEDVAYWEELTHIFDYVRQHVYSTLFLCWSAQAALYYYYGIQKKLVDEKIFGTERFLTRHTGPLTHGFDRSFLVPQSRYTYVDLDDVLGDDRLIVYAGSEASGAQLVSSSDHRFVFMAGHLEYDDDTLSKEFLRDVAKGLNPALPENYYVNDDPNEGILGGWKASANSFFTNWINYCVYQQTPFVIDDIHEKSVAKFGGTSLSEAGQFSKVKQIVEADQPRVIVASAPGKRFEKDKKVTDLLVEYSNHQLERLSLDQRLAELTDLCRDGLRQFSERYQEIAERLDLGEDALDEIGRVKRSLEKATDRSHIISRGEYLNAKLLAKYLNYRFVDATELIKFDASGNLNHSETDEAIQEMIKPGQRVVVPGFYGENSHGHIKLLDRGGSDITGSLIASALGADVYQTWTDVSGVMDEDPAKNPLASVYDFLSYEQLLAIAQAGAQVYHPDAIEPLKRHNTRLEIKNTNEPSAKGTKVGNHEDN